MKANVFLLSILFLVGASNVRASFLIPVTPQDVLGDFKINKHVKAVIADLYTNHLFSISPVTSRALCRRAGVALHSEPAKGRVKWALKCLKEAVEAAPPTGSWRSGFDSIALELLTEYDAINSTAPGGRILYPIFGKIELVLPLRNGQQDKLLPMQATSVIHSDVEAASCDGVRNSFLVGICANVEGGGSG